jgi:hypothetical protein
MIATLKPVVVLHVALYAFVTVANLATGTGDQLVNTVN